jgi:hypothetical protein
MEDGQSAFGDFEKTVDRVMRFSSPLSVPVKTVPSMRKWIEIPTEELKDELIHRNGRFQSMLGFMRHSLQACMVIDALGRIIFINEATGHYWKVRLWDVQGKNLCQVMRLDEIETARNKRERERVLEQRFPEVFLEHFHNGGQRISMFCFPFPDDHGDMLLGAFILPHSGSGVEQKPGY